MRWIYTFGIQCYAVGIKIASTFNPKAKLFVSGRRHQTIKTHEGCIWFHCASLGEFEQAKPIIEQLKTENSTTKIVITFFSPSGYELRKNYELADAVYYLPIDTVGNARNFISTLQPKMAIFVKYEVWPNYFNALNKVNIPIIIVSATFRANQIYFKPWGVFFKMHLEMTKHIFVQNESSKSLLISNKISQTTVSGDTRFDRVFNQLKAKNENEIIARFKGVDLLVIIGSSWQEEENLLIPFINTSPTCVKFVIAPHHINENRINEIKSKLTVPFSLYTDGFSKENVLILNTIGHLASAYCYANIAVVGGGFKNALHNILEPATFGIPIIYGNNHAKFPEGHDLSLAGGGFSVSQTNLKQQILSLISNEELRHESGIKARQFIEQNIGATDVVCQYINKL